MSDLFFVEKGIEVAFSVGGSAVAAYRFIRGYVNKVLATEKAIGQLAASFAAFELRVQKLEHDASDVDGGKREWEKKVDDTRRSITNEADRVERAARELQDEAARIVRRELEPLLRRMRDVEERLASTVTDEELDAASVQVKAQISRVSENLAYLKGVLETMKDDR